MDPDLDRHSVGPDLGPNCLQRLSTEGKLLKLIDTSKERVSGKQSLAIIAIFRSDASKVKLSHKVVKNSKLRGTGFELSTH